MPKQRRSKITRGPLKGRVYKTERGYRRALHKVPSRPISRGPLKGRVYKTERGYRRALERIHDRDIIRDARYNELLQAFILQKGARYAKQHLKRFRKLYRKAKAKDFNPCPPVYNGRRASENDAPYAYLLDFIGARPIDEFGWRCIGDTP